MTTETNLFQHWMPINLKLNKTEPCARHNSTQNSKCRGYLTEWITWFSCVFNDKALEAISTAEDNILKRAQQCWRSLCSVRIGDVARIIGACCCWSRAKRIEPLCVVCFGTRNQIYRKSYFSEAEKIATNSRRPWNSNGRFRPVEQCEKSDDFEREIRGSLILCRERLCWRFEIKGEDIEITSDSDNDEDELEIL